MAKVNTANLIRSFEKSVEKIQKQWWRNLSASGLVVLIKGLIIKGVSPVDSGGRFAKYSQSYLKQIRGEAKFFTSKNGNVFAVEPKLIAAAKTSVKFKDGKVIQGRTTKDKFEKFEKGLGVGKKVSPVSMKVSGEMLESLTFNASNGVLTGKSPLWKFHSEGQGNLPVRKLLPYQNGESFSRRINQKLTEELTKATKQTFSKTKRFFKINIKVN